MNICGCRPRCRCHVDSAISKTVNCPEDMPFEEFRPLYEHAFEMGLKGCTAYRPNPITGFRVVDADRCAAERRTAGRRTPGKSAADSRGRAGARSPAAGREHSGGDQWRGRLYVGAAGTRWDRCQGFTYKLKWPDSDHAIYVTLNDIIQDGRRRPFEIFINSKNLEHYAWTVALTRMISAVFRRGGDVSFVVEELKAVFDPRGGQWMDGRYVPSLLAAIGGIIERHMIDIGFIAPAERIVPETQSR